MELTERLEQLFSGREKVTIEELNGAIASLDDLLALVPHDYTEPSQLPYGRNTLLRNKNYEVVVINLPGNQATAIHDHGDSIGCAFVVQGELLNTTYTLDANGYPMETHTSLVKTGEMMESAIGHIHEMRNPNKEAMLSIHVYSPPLQNVKAYVPYSEVLDYVI